MLHNTNLVYGSRNGGPTERAAREGGTLHNTHSLLCNGHERACEEGRSHNANAFANATSSGDAMHHANASRCDARRKESGRRLYSQPAPAFFSTSDLASLVAKDVYKPLTFPTKMLSMRTSTHP